MPGSGFESCIGQVPRNREITIPAWGVSPRTATARSAAITGDHDSEYIRAGTRSRVRETP